MMVMTVTLSSPLSVHGSSGWELASLQESRLREREGMKGNGLGVRESSEELHGR